MFYYDGLSSVKQLNVSYMYHAYQIGVIDPFRISYIWVNLTDHH